MANVRGAVPLAKNSDSLGLVGVIDEPLFVVFRHFCGKTARVPHPFSPLPNGAPRAGPGEGT